MTLDYALEYSINKFIKQLKQIQNSIPLFLGDAIIKFEGWRGHRAPSCDSIQCGTIKVEVPRCKSISNLIVNCSV